MSDRAANKPPDDSWKTEAPLKPRPLATRLLGIVLIALMAGLLTMYFKTVYPYRNDVQPVEVDAPR